MANALPRDVETGPVVSRPTMRPAQDSGLATAERLVAGYTEAFNARDVDGVLQQFDAAIVFRPTRLSGTRSCYRGHQQVREWMDAVLANRIPYRSRVTNIYQLEHDRWAVVGNVMVDNEPMVPYVFTIRLRDGLIAELESYLSDEKTLGHLGRLA